MLTFLDLRWIQIFRAVHTCEIGGRDGSVGYMNGPVNQRAEEGWKNGKTSGKCVDSRKDSCVGGWVSRGSG